MDVRIRNLADAAIAGDEKVMPKVSVCMVTYNHARFIAQAIESVLTQETDFPCELVIGEDCSTDGTGAIVADYQKRYPDRIRAFIHEQNVGAAQNWLQVLGACRGEYITYLDGDDYWTDVLKLQKQVAYLESHPECAMVFSGVLRTFQGGGQVVLRPAIRKTAYGVADLMEGNFIQACAAMYRHLYRGKYPPWLERATFGDWAFNLLHAIHGDIGYIDEVMAVHRIHDNGVFSSMTRLKQITSALETASLLREKLPASVPLEKLDEYITKLRCEYVTYALVWGLDPVAGRAELLSLLRSAVWPFEKPSHFFRSLVWLVAPRVGRALQKNRHKGKSGGI